jgi:hypothetical protein
MSATYDLEDTGSAYLPYRELVKCEGGDWVLTEDHDKEVKAQKVEIERLREALERILYNSEGTNDMWNTAKDALDAQL